MKEVIELVLLYALAWVVLSTIIYFLLGRFVFRDYEDHEGDE